MLNFHEVHNDIQNGNYLFLCGPRASNMLECEIVSSCCNCFGIKITLIWNERIISGTVCIDKDYIYIRYTNPVYFSIKVLPKE